MRADVVEAELADEEESKYETLEDIERRKKNEKLEQKEKERKEKMREERLKRIQAFQAAAHLKERSDEEDGNDEEEDDDEEDEVVEEQEPVENPFYSSYKEAVQNEEELEDPLKEAREREKRKVEEDAAALKKLEEERLAQEKRAGEPPQKKARTSSESEGSKFSGVGAVAEMLAEEKERIRQELAQEEERVRRKEAEKVLRKSRRRGDPNNPTKEEVEAAQELEALTWQVLSCKLWQSRYHGMMITILGSICDEQEGRSGGELKQDDQQGSFHLMQARPFHTRSRCVKSKRWRNRRTRLKALRVSHQDLKG